ncbi:SAM-dependent methyltransferase [Bacillus thuringiensis serovar pingluonsis]|uniref:SAM-dependent methyltransferase n=1 Tax=Bacillus thuringiensis serovar pingluonsis TaxID=180881 RepID=A0A243BBS1_BACTU|nr:MULTISPECIES: class I SAM-dependent methyltransferase [Bacillus cereus group]MEB9684728.1 class I SAM-dependent methyltransferase [Bacillus anthracis]OTY42026.1 SAM-dependent methyltransferase [Bacillus thuringiensis serovar pingluonsis]
MKQNVYDHPQFFEGYKNLREGNSGLNDVLEQPALRKLLPQLVDTRILDIGSGMGQFVMHCSQQGAKKVIGADISKKMIEFSQKNNRDVNTEFICSAIEDLQFDNQSFDLVTSSLVLHYIKDFRGIASKIHKWLDTNGIFIFSIEHPIVTSTNSMQGWICNEQGQKVYWPVDNYSEEGSRNQSWFIDGVIKYHRKISSIVNELIEEGFQIERIEEPEAILEAVTKRPELGEHRRRPPLLLIKCHKR